MPRSAWKGPYVSVQLLRDVISLAQKYPEWWQQGRFKGVTAPEVINTRCRSSTILPDFLRVKFGIHNGKDYIPVEVSEEMVGHRLWEFAKTTKLPVHKVKEAKGGKKINPKTGKAS